MRIYVAGASAEVDIVAAYIAQLRAHGAHITHDWTTSVLAAREAKRSDRDLSEKDRALHACDDVDGVRRAGSFWLLVPDVATAGCGCWIELGYALANRSRVVVSGDWRRSIFTALAHHRFDSHAAALSFLKGNP